MFCIRSEDAGGMGVWKPYRINIVRISLLTSKAVQTIKNIKEEKIFCMHLDWYNEFHEISISH